MYLAMGAIWVYYCYHCFGDQLYAPGTIPQLEDILEQMKVRGSWGCMSVGGRPSAPFPLL
jgi:hypothetical protein